MTEIEILMEIMKSLDRIANSLEKISNRRTGDDERGITPEDVDRALMEDS